MNNEVIDGRRQFHDRRKRPTSALDAFRMNGRRRGPRRDEERVGGYFVDRFDAVTLALVVALLGLTIADGILTIELVDLNSEEANPIMAHLLNRGKFEFLLGKYILTAAGMPFLVLYQHHPMFGTRFRVGWLLPVFVGLYLVLLFHQWTLLQVGRPSPTIDDPELPIRSSPCPDTVLSASKRSPRLIVLT